jgi:hypothetical protein
MTHCRNFQLQAREIIIITTLLESVIYATLRA